MRNAAGRRARPARSACAAGRRRPRRGSRRAAAGRRRPRCCRPRAPGRRLRRPARSAAPPAITSPISGRVSGASTPILRNICASASLASMRLSGSTSSRAGRRPSPAISSVRSRPSSAPRVMRQRRSSNDCTGSQLAVEAGARDLLAAAQAGAARPAKPATGLRQHGARLLHADPVDRGVEQHRQQQVGQRARPPRWPRANAAAGC